MAAEKRLLELELKGPFGDQDVVVAFVSGPSPLALDEN